MSMIGMGLNQDTLDELKPTDGVVAPNQVNAGNGTDIVIDYSSKTTNENGQVVIDHFEDFNIILEDSESLEKEQVRLEDVAQVVLSAESISFSDVQSYLKMADTTVDETAEGGLTAGIVERLERRVPLSSYTEDKTAVNLDETKKFFKQELKVNKDKIHGLYNDFFTSKAEMFITRANLLVQHIHVLLEEQEAWAAQCAQFQATSVTSKNYLAYVIIKAKAEAGEELRETTKKTLYDIRHFPLGNCRFGNIIENGMGIRDDLFYMVNEFFNSASGKEFTTTLRRAGVYEVSSNVRYYRTFLEAIGSTGEEYSSPTYAELLAFFASGEITAKLTQMKLYLEKNIALFSALKEGIVDGQPFTYEGNVYTFHEAGNTALQLITGAHDAAKFCTMCELSKSVCLPVFVAMNDVLTA